MTNHFFTSYLVVPIFAFLRDKKLIRKETYTKSLKEVGVQSQYILKRIRNSFPLKFHMNFIHADSEMQKYKQRLMTAAQNMFSPRLQEPSTAAVNVRHLVRVLPHAADLKLFFPASIASDINYVENQDDGVSTAMRQHSTFSDSCKMYNYMATGAYQLLQDMKDELSAVDFMHGYTYSGPFGRDVSKKFEFNALDIHAPLSMVHAIDTQTLPERTRIRLDAITTTAAGDAAKTALSELGLEDTYHAFHAVSIISGFLSEELLAAERANDTLHDVSKMVQGPFQSAIQRTINAQQLIKAQLKQTNSVLFVDRDRLLGTRTGRDAVFVVNTINIDSLGHPKDRIKLLTLIISSMQQVVNRLLQLQSNQSGRGGSLIVATRLPSEPLSSFFQMNLCGPNAILRIRRLVEYARLNPTNTPVARLVWAVASTYASSGARQQVDILPVLTRPPRDAMECTTAIYRMARLRIDVDVASVYDLNNSAQTTDDAIERLAINFSNASFSAKWKNTQSDMSALFYVPFGYGGKPFALKWPAPPPSLIGSVPMWCDDVRWAMDRVLSSFISPGDAAPATASTIRTIRFVYNPCVINNEGVQKRLQSPLFIAVNTTDSTTEAVVYGTVPRPRHPYNDEKIQFGDLLNRFGHKDHAESQTHASLNESISDVIWNADRIVQAAMATLHVCGAYEHAPFYVELLPDQSENDTVGETAKEINALRLQKDDTLKKTPEKDIGALFGTLPDELLSEQSTVITEAHLFYTNMQDLATTAAGLAEKIAATEEGIAKLKQLASLLGQDNSTGTFPWVGESDGGTYATHVLETSLLGDDDDALYLAKNALPLYAMFTNEFFNSNSWATVGARRFFDQIKEETEYKNALRALFDGAKTLSERFQRLDEKRILALNTTTRRLKARIENTRTVANRTAECLVASTVIANAMLSSIVGRDMANICLVRLDHPLLESDFKKRIISAFSNTVRVSEDDERDVAKLSEVCAIILSFLDSI